MAAEVEAIPPPYVIAENDKRGLVVVITATTLSFVWTCLFIRLWLRLKPREWKLDDYFLAAATILDTVLAGLVFHVVNVGLGRSEEELNGFEDLRRIGKDDFSIQILYILTLFLSKCGVLFLYLRLSPRKGHTLASWSTMIFSAIWAIIAIVLIAVPCKPSHYWPHGFGQCSSITARWKAITALDIIIEATMFGISVYLVARLKMKTKSKALVVAAFSLRVPVIAAAGARLHCLSKTLSSQNRTLEAGYYLVCTQTQVSYAIISSTLTGMGPFLRPFSQSKTYSGQSSSHPNSALNRTNPGAHGENYQEQEAVTYELKSIQTHRVTQRQKRKHTNTPSEELNLRPAGDLVKQDTAVLGGGDADQEDSVSRLSDDSQRMIITKKTEFTVEMDRTSVKSRDNGERKSPSHQGDRNMPYTRKPIELQKRGPRIKPKEAGA